MMRRTLPGAVVLGLLWAGAGGAAAQTGVQAPPQAQAQAAADEGPLAVRAGSPAGAVQLVVFGDIEDEASGRLVAVLSRVIETYPDVLGVTFRLRAPEEHLQSALAYRHALAAARQGKGWAMLDMACANTDRLDDAGLRSMLAQLNLDATRAAADAASDEAGQVLGDDEAEAGTLKVGAVPAVFVNGARLEGPYTFESIAAAIRKN